MVDVVLAGCAPTPLGSYLKAVGMLRLVARQAETRARGWWQDDVFVLRSHLNEDGLVDFLLNSYQPTPVVSPWNGASGFYPKDSTAALERIEAQTSPRLANYRRTIATAREALKANEGVAAKDHKAALVRRCRAEFPDVALEWLDAALVLTMEDLAYPPLLVSGGNDGRLEFSYNFMQRLCDVLPELAGGNRGSSAVWARASLFGGEPARLVEAAVGMFSPGSAGGVNATTGFEGESLVNPWDFVLMVEGVILFAGAAARRLGQLEGAGKAAFPFTVQPSSAGVEVGASGTERPRAEVWMPMWGHPSGLPEVEHLCAEGRAEWRRRQAQDGVEFAQAVAALGVARGVDSFVRYAIYKRMGNNHVATPVRRVPVRRVADVDLLASIDWWVRLFRDESAREDAPAALRDVRVRLERAIFELCLRGGAGPGPAQAVLVALGRAELAFAFREALARAFRPLSLDRRWLQACNDGSPEFRLAAALGSVGAATARPLRTNLEPVALEGRRLVRRAGKAQVWGGGGVLRDLESVFQRRLLDAAMDGEPTDAQTAGRPARLADVERLLRGNVELDRLADLVVGLSLIQWGPPTDSEAIPERLPPALPRAYALLRLCCLPFPFELEGEERAVPLEPSIFAVLAAGRTADAVRHAAERLRGSGVGLHSASGSPALARGVEPHRLLAALLIPISRRAAAALAASVAIPTDSEVAP